LKIVHLVGLTIEIYQDARSHDHQSCGSSFHAPVCGTFEWHCSEETEQRYKTAVESTRLTVMFVLPVICISALE